MAEEDGSENLILRLYMRLLSQNLDVLSSFLSHLSMVGRVWTTLGQDLQLRVLEEEELSTDPVPKASISNPMARTPYVTVRGPEPAQPAPKPKETTMIERRELSGSYGDPEPVKEDTGPPMPDPVEFDDQKANALLDIVLKTKDLPTLSALSGSAMQQLVKMNKEVADETGKLQEEWKAAYAEWENKKKKEAEEKRKKEEEKEKAA